MTKMSSTKIPIIIIFNFYFLIKLNKIENECTRTWFEISGRRELSHLCNELKIESHSASQIKKDIWSSFSRNAVFV